MAFFAIPTDRELGDVQQGDFQAGFRQQFILSATARGQGRAGRCEYEVVGGRSDGWFWKKKRRSRLRSLVEQVGVIDCQGKGRSISWKHKESAICVEHEVRGIVSELRSVVADERKKRSKKFFQERGR